MLSVTEIGRSQIVPFKRQFDFRIAMWKETPDKEICNHRPKGRKL